MAASSLAELPTRAHLNLIESSKRLFELDPRAEIEAGEGWLFGAGSHDHPAITNTAFRGEDGLDPAELIERAREFFGSRGRGFCLWARDGAEEDEDLFAACEAEGLAEVFSMPEMVLEAPAEAPELRRGVSIRPFATAGEAADFWRIAGASYAELGFPPEVFTQYTDDDGLLGEGFAVYFGDLDGEPAAIGLTIVADGVAGIYWIGSLPQARGHDLGRAVTAAVTNAGFELGADFASLQASPLGRPIYEAMGYRTIYDYRLRFCPPPA